MQVGSSSSGDVTSIVKVLFLKKGFFGEKVWQCYNRRKPGYQDDLEARLNIVILLDIQVHKVLENSLVAGVDKVNEVGVALELDLSGEDVKIETHTKLSQTPGSVFITSARLRYTGRRTQSCPAPL